MSFWDWILVIPKALTTYIISWILVILIVAALVGIIYVLTSPLSLFYDSNKHTDDDQT